MVGLRLSLLYASLLMEHYFHFVTPTQPSMISVHSRVKFCGTIKK